MSALYGCNGRPRPTPATSHVGQAGWREFEERGAPVRVPDMVLDIFNGSGTSGQVSLEKGRHYTGLEINPEYLELTRGRLTGALAARAAAAAAKAIKDAEPQQLSLLG